MTDPVATTETTSAAPPPPPTLTDALRNPSRILARRAEIVKLATDRAQQATASARTRFQKAEAVATARAQELRKSTDALVTTALARVRKVSVPARVRTAVHDGLVRSGQALQSLASRIKPTADAPVERPPAKTD